MSEEAEHLYGQITPQSLDLGLFFSRGLRGPIVASERSSYPLGAAPLFLSGQCTLRLTSLP
jgi:hypothetical protein